MLKMAIYGHLSMALKMMYTQRHRHTGTDIDTQTHTCMLTHVHKYMLTHVHRHVCMQHTHTDTHTKRSQDLPALHRSKATQSPHLKEKLPGSSGLNLASVPAPSLPPIAKLFFPKAKRQ